MKLTELLRHITPLPWRFAEMDNDKVIPTVRILGRRRHDPAKEACFGRLDFVPDSRYATHAANVLPELVAAAKNVQENWSKNLTEPMARLNKAIALAENVNPSEATQGPDKQDAHHENGTHHP
jgi:hypothetical protein